MTDWKTALEVLNWRIDNDLSYEAAAKILGVARKTLWAWEHKGARPHKRTAARCQRAMAEYNGGKS